MEKKYEFTGETLGKLKRIRALRDFRFVKKGDLGGYIKGEHNLSHDGDCWVYDGKIYGNAEVYGNVLVYSGAEVCGDAKVYGNAEVCEDAKVYGNAEVCEDAKVYESARVFGNAKVYGDARVRRNAFVCGESIICGESQINQ